MKKRLKSLLIAGLLANAAWSTQAQTTTLPAAHHPMAAASSSKMHGMGMDPAKMQARVEKHLAELKTKLKITAAQEGAWTTFAAGMKPPARMEPARPNPADMDKLTTPERIEKMRALRAQRMSEQQANMDKREDAVKTFYAALDSSQKKVFDAEHSKMMHRWGDRMNDHGDRHHGGADHGTPAAKAP